MTVEHAGSTEVDGAVPLVRLQRLLAKPQETGNQTSTVVVERVMCYPLFMG